MHISTECFYILCKVIYLIQYMLLALHSRNKLLITFLPRSINSSLGTLLFLLRAYLKRDLYGFHSYIFAIFIPSFFSEISTNLYTIHTMLSTIHCNREKTSSKGKLFPLLPVIYKLDSILVIHSLQLCTIC